MRLVRLVSILSLLTFPLLAASRFGTYTGVVAQVPFEFVVGNHTVPSGTCVVQPNNPAAQTILVRNPVAKVDVFTTASSFETTKNSESTALIFRQYGDRYFLSAIRLQGMNTIYELPPSKAEIELRNHNVPSTERVVLPL